MPKKQHTINIEESIRIYRTLGTQIEEMEVQRQSLKNSITQEMTRLKVDAYPVNGLIARTGSRMERKYRVIPELAAILKKAGIIPKIGPGEIDKAIKAKKLKEADVKPFVQARLIPYFGVYRDGEGVLNE